MREQIIQLLREKRMKEALTHLVVYSAKAHQWYLQQEVEDLQMSYDRMLQYTKEGMKDPDKENIYRRLIRSAYELTDRIYTHERMQHPDDHYYTLMKTDANRPPLPFAQLQLRLEAYTENIHTAPLLYANPQRQAEEALAIRKEHYRTVDELFHKVWTSQGWTDGEEKEANELLQSPLVQTSDLAILISAITMNQLHVFDVRKFHFLLTAYAHPEALVNQRALIGIALTCYYHDERLQLYPETISRLNELQEDPSFVKELHQVQIQLFQSARETQKIDKKMREEIIPELIKTHRLQHPRLGIDATEMSDDQNPEWEEWMQQSDAHKKMREMADMQQEGADIYMGTFSQLKNFPFFQQVPHWFYLFDPLHPDFVQPAVPATGEGPSFFELLALTDNLCNSDRYSLGLTMGSMPEAQRKNLQEHLGGQLKQMMELCKQQQLSVDPLTDKITICRQYIQDMYRFFKLWMKRYEMHDIFQDDLALWKRKTLATASMHPDYLHPLADFLFAHGYLEEADTLYRISIERYHSNDALVWQKRGYICQKAGKYAEAIAHYLQSDLLMPDNVWNNRHIAQCYKKEGDYEKAIEFYKKVEKVQPDHLNLALQIGQCLLELARYEEALTYFFKVEYMDKKPQNARRGIAWCSFVTGKTEEAKKYYNLLTAEPHPIVEDWMNAGHVYYLLGDTVQAIACYRQAQRLCKSHQAFLERYRADKDELLKQGMSEIDFYLLPDELV